MQNYFLFPQLIAALLNLILAIYIIFFKPKNKITITVTLLLISLFLFSLGELLTRMAGQDAELALRYHILVILSINLILGSFLYLSTIYPKDLSWPKKNILNALWTVLIITCVAFFIYGCLRMDDGSALILNNELGFFQTAQLDLYLGGQLYIPILTTMLFMMITGLIVFFWRFLRETERAKKNIAVIVTGMLFFYIADGITNILFPMMSIGDFSMISIGAIILGASIAFMLSRHRFLAISPAIENRGVHAGSTFEKGNYYIIVENDTVNPSRSYEIFSRHVKNGIPGLIITQKNPGEIRKKLELVKTPAIYLTVDKSENSGNDIFISPTELNENAGLVLDFIKKNNGAIVIVDCLELIFSLNIRDPEHRDMLLDNVRTLLKAVIDSDGMLIVPMHSSWLSKPPPESGIIKKDNIMRVANFWPALILERCCNNAIAHLSREDMEKIPEKLEQLSKWDSFFTQMGYSNGRIVVMSDFRKSFSVQDAIRYLKMFLVETGLEISQVVQEMKSLLAEYGIYNAEYNLEAGKGYFAFTKSIDMSYRTFIDLLTIEYHGIYISRTHHRKFGKLSPKLSEYAQFRWMTEIAEDEKTISPRLEHIFSEIEDFLENTRGCNSIVVIEDLEYLIRRIGSVNDVHLFISRVRDIVSDSMGIFLVCARKGALTDDERALLLQELEPVEIGA